MRNAAKLLLPILVFVIGAASPGDAADRRRPQQAEIVPNAAVVGQVLDGLTGTPVPDVQVFAGGANVVTDAKGRFVLRDLPSGRFTITADSFSLAARVHGSGMYGQTTWSDNPRFLEARSGQVIQGIAVPFWREGTIVGRVLDDDGVPVAGARVAAVQWEGSGYQWKTTSDSLRTAETGDDGIFRLDHAPGPVIVRVSNHHARARSVPGDPANPRLFVFPDVFFPDALDFAGAKPIALKPGEERTVTDVRLIPAPAARLTGVVFDARGPAGGALLTLVPVDGSEEADGNRGAAEADASGRFSFVGVAPGHYFLGAWRPDAGAGAPVATADTVLQEMAQMEVAVSGRDLKDLRLTLLPCPRLVGRFVFDGVSRPPDDELRSLMVMPATERPSLSCIDQHSAPYDGTFDVRTSAGRQILDVGRSPDGWTLRSVVVAGRDVTDRTIDVPPSATVTAVVTLTDRLTTLKGAVQPRSDGPPFDTAVLVFPTDQTYWHDFRWQSPRMPIISVDRLGAFEEEDMPPGDYYIVAIPDIDEDNWRSVDALGDLIGFATRIRLAEGETKMVSLAVARVPRRAPPSPRRADGRQAWMFRDIAAPQDQPAAPAVPVLEGRVVAVDTGVPLPGAWLEIERVCPAIQDAVSMLAGVTDEEGRFAIAGVLPGAYRLTATRPPFRPSHYGAGPSGGEGMPIVVRSGGRLNGLTIGMWPAAGIKGVITDDRGQPVIDALVNAHRIVWTTQGRFSGDRMAGARTDNRGSYEIAGLDPGEYGIQVTAFAARDRLPVTTSGDLAHPLVAEPQTANRVWRETYGDVSYPAGFVPRSPAGPGLELRSGERRVLDLQMGPGRLVELPPHQVRMPWIQGVQQQPQLAIEGRVRWTSSSSGAADLADLQLVLKPIATLDWVWMWRRGDADANGRFRIASVLAQRCRWAVTGSGTNPASRLVTSAMVNGRETLDTGIHPTDDGSVDDVIVTVTNRPAAIAGTIEAPGGQRVRPPDGVYVVLFPADAGAWLPQSPRIRAARPDTDAAFSFEGLVPGMYYLSAVLDVAENDWLNPEVLARVAVTASKITVVEGQSLVTRIRLPAR